MYKIMVVDDEDEIRTSVAEMLINKKYEVHQARNGKEAFIMINNKIPDLIISDIMMPVMDGIKLLEMLKKEAATKDIPFIVLSAKSSGSNKDICIAKGADEYINKPFDALDLYNAVSKNLNKNKKNGGRHEMV